MTGFAMRLGAPLAALCALALFGPADAQVRLIGNGRIAIRLADPATGNTTVNSNRVDSLTWVNSAGNVSGNLASSGGPPVCNDPYETFGQARGDVQEEPRFVVAGTRAPWTQDAGQTLRARTATRHWACNGVALAGTAISNYAVFTAPTKVNLLAIVRKFSFNGSGRGVNHNLRAYMPRLPDGTYDTVLVPDSTGVIQTFSALACDGICQVTDWNGKWLADDDGNGNGMMIIRDPAATLPAQVDVDHDGYSNSNSSAIALLPPSGGWSGRIAETEYLCFYDAVSWPAGKRMAGKLPAGCAVEGF